MIFKKKIAESLEEKLTKIIEKYREDSSLEVDYDNRKINSIIMHSAYSGAGALGAIQLLTPLIKSPVGIVGVLTLSAVAGGAAVVGGVTLLYEKYKKSIENKKINASTEMKKSLESLNINYDSDLRDEIIFNNKISMEDLVKKVASRQKPQ